MCPNEMVPLQIDRAIGVGRYLLADPPNPGSCGAEVIRLAAIAWRPTRKPDSLDENDDDR